MMEFLRPRALALLPQAMLTLGTPANLEIQARPRTMTVYELLFILPFLASVVGVLATVLQWARGRRDSARTLLLLIGSVWTVYLSTLLAADAQAKQQVTKYGDNLCFDEMCFAVVSTEVTKDIAKSHQPDQIRYVVHMRMTSQSLGRPQAEGGLRGRLFKDGRYFTVIRQAQQKYEALHGVSPKLTQKLNPGETIVTALVFEVPRDVTNPALTLDHGFTPGYFVIGESPFFHKPPIMELSPE